MIENESGYLKSERGGAFDDDPQLVWRGMEGPTEFDDIHHGDGPIHGLRLVLSKQRVRLEDHDELWGPMGLGRR